MNPVNDEAPKFGVEFLREMVINYNNVFDASSVCNAMQDIVEDPETLDVSPTPVCIGAPKSYHFM